MKAHLASPFGISRRLSPWHVLALLLVFTILGCTQNMTLSHWTTGLLFG